LIKNQRSKRQRKPRLRLSAEETEEVDDTEEVEETEETVDVRRR
jgi:hypothetical protein